MLYQFVLKLWTILTGLNLLDANFLVFDIIFHMAEVGFIVQSPLFGPPPPPILMAKQD